MAGEVVCTCPPSLPGRGDMGSRGEYLRRGIRGTSASCSTEHGHDGGNRPRHAAAPAPADDPAACMTRRARTDARIVSMCSLSFNDKYVIESAKCHGMLWVLCSGFNMAPSS